MADQLDELASIIAEKALQRLRGPDFARIGREEPTCSTPAPRAVTPAETPKGMQHRGLRAVRGVPAVQRA